MLAGLEPFNRHERWFKACARLWLASLLLVATATAQEAISVTAKGINLGMDETVVRKTLGEPSRREALISTYESEFPPGAVEYKYPLHDDLTVFVEGGQVVAFSARRIDLTGLPQAISLGSSLKEAKLALDDEFVAQNLVLSDTKSMREWRLGGSLISCAFEGEEVLYWLVEFNPEH